ncbi:MAG: hypothetical protein R3338_15815, partial [Thermoanaerobaculia bacterium]|nr:hypothetical protein [Thermoanaerobaculia bacterium]
MIPRPSRVILIAVGLVAAIVAGSRVAVWNVERRWDDRIHAELGQRVAELDARISTTREELATDLASLERLSEGARTRSDLFRDLDRVDSPSSSGMLVSNERGDLIAWWGEYFPFEECGTFCFDTTDLYVSSTRGWQNDDLRLRATAFKRVPLRPAALIEDRWIRDVHLHGGALMRAEGARRDLLAREGDATVWVDLIPETPARIIDEIESVTLTFASLVLALAFVILAVILYRRSERSAVPWLALVMIVLARLSLL